MNSDHLTYIVEAVACSLFGLWSLGLGLRLRTSPRPIIVPAWLSVVPLTVLIALLILPSIIFALYRNGLDWRWFALVALLLAMMVFTFVRDRGYDILGADADAVRSFIRQHLLEHGTVFEERGLVFALAPSESGIMLEVSGRPGFARVKMYPRGSGRLLREPMESLRHSYAAPGSAVNPTAINQSLGAGVVFLLASVMFFYFAGVLS